MTEPANLGYLERLKGKAGPLPIWLWAVLVVGGGYLLYRHYQGSSSSSSDSGSSDEPDNKLSDADIAAGIIGADYDLRNQLNYTNADLATLATNVNANTQAERREEGETPNKYAVVQYGGHLYELGRHGGAGISKTEEGKIKKWTGPHPEKSDRYAELKWAPDVYYDLKDGKAPRLLSKTEFDKIKHHPKVTVVSSNTHVNISPGKVKR